jgi:hypothetical protein
VLADQLAELRPPRPLLGRGEDAAAAPDWAGPALWLHGDLTLANSNQLNHTVQTRALNAYLRWRNAGARHPDVLAAQRRERARIRSEKGIRWGGRPVSSAA